MPRIKLSHVDASLHYERQGEGPVLLLLNGLSQSTANWRSQMRALRDHFDVIAFDARGQGRSDLGPTPIQLEDQVQDIEELLDALDVEEVSLAGFSHGARVALAFGAARPDRVERLVLTSVGTNQGPHRTLITRSWKEVLERGGVEAMAWCTLPHILGEDFVRAYRDQFEGIVRATCQRNSEEGLHALLDALLDYPEPRGEARAVRAPVLLITSDRDPLVPLEDARDLADCFDDVNHVIVRGCGHTIPIEVAGHWRRLLLRFFDMEVDASGISD